MGNPPMDHLRCSACDPPHLDGRSLRDLLNHSGTSDDARRSSERFDPPRRSQAVDAFRIDNVLSERFRLRRAPTLAAPMLSGVPIAFTRLRCDEANHGRAGPVPMESSFAFQVVLRPIRSWTIWDSRKHTRLPAASPGDIHLFDLSENPRLELHDPFDLVRFYISQSTLISLAQEHGGRGIGGLRLSDPGTRDPLMHGLAAALVGSMDRPSEAQAMFVEHIALAFHAHVAHTYGGVRVRQRSVGGLTPRQLRRACDAMQSALHGKHSIASLATECGLSSGHFAKAFKEATGLAPHQWLTRKRLEHARELLVHTRLELSTIASTCGFADQSHLSRAFARHMRQSPGRWRRQCVD